MSSCTFHLNMEPRPRGKTVYWVGRASSSASDLKSTLELCSVHPRSGQDSWITVFTTLRMFNSLLYAVPTQCVLGGIPHRLHPILLGD